MLSHVLIPGFTIISQFKKINCFAGNHWRLAFFPANTCSAGLGSFQEAGKSEIIFKFPVCSCFIPVGEIESSATSVTADSKKPPC